MSRMSHGSPPNADRIKDQSFAHALLPPEPFRARTVSRILSQWMDPECIEDQFRSVKTGNQRLPVDGHCATRPTTNVQMTESDPSELRHTYSEPPNPNEDDGNSEQGLQEEPGPEITRQAKLLYNHMLQIKLLNTAFDKVSPALQTFGQDDANKSEGSTQQRVRMSLFL